MTKAEFLQEWENVTLIKCFEEKVIDTRTNEIDYIIFDITIQNDKFEATHVGLTQEQEDSEKIAFQSIDIDYDFSIDENLQELYSECVTAILNSEFFSMIE